MKNLTIYLVSSLSTLAAAVTTTAYTKGGCSGPYISCTNIAPRTCCVVAKGTQGGVSASWNGIPGSSTLYGWQHIPKPNGAYCGHLVASRKVGAGNYCDTINPDIGEFAGLSYNRDSAKRSTEEHKCTSSVFPDIFGLEDGHEFNIAGMDADMVEELWALGHDGATIDSIPEHFLQFRI